MMQIIQKQALGFRCLSCITPALAKDTMTLREGYKTTYLRARVSAHCEEFRNMLIRGWGKDKWLSFLEQDIGRTLTFCTPWCLSVWGFCQTTKERISVNYYSESWMWTSAAVQSKGSWIPAESLGSARRAYTQKWGCQKGGQFRVRDDFRTPAFHTGIRSE